MPDRVVLGRVLVSDGVEVKTAIPHYNISTLYTASPRNPIANIIFDNTGQVLHAELSRSSGFMDVDGPILSSLYKWRASGEKIRKLKDKDTFIIHGMTLLLVDEPEAKPEAQNASPDAQPAPE